MSSNQPILKVGAVTVSELYNTLEQEMKEHG